MGRGRGRPGQRMLFARCFTGRFEYCRLGNASCEPELGLLAHWWCAGSSVLWWSMRLHLLPQSRSIGTSGLRRKKEPRPRKRSEQLRATVMDALAHEFKTPLTAVQTASSGLLELGGLTESQRDLVTLIDEEAIRLNQLCTRLLKAAKLEAKQVGLQTAEVNVVDLVSEVLAGHPAEAERNSIQVAVEDPSLTVRADRGLLAMILTQYIDNARKYSTAGTPIAIAARSSHTEVLISVHNFGSTIRIEDRERIFERFYRSPELKDAVPGTGIGLSVVKKAAEAHHGHVWVISDEQGRNDILSFPSRSTQGGRNEYGAGEYRAGHDPRGGRRQFHAAGIARDIVWNGLHGCGGGSRRGGIIAGSRDLVRCGAIGRGYARNGRGRSLPPYPARDGALADPDVDSNG